MCQILSQNKPQQTKIIGRDVDTRGEAAVPGAAASTAIIEGGVGGLPATCFPKGNMTPSMTNICLADVVP
jgi:hypothetical protein